MKKKVLTLKQQETFQKKIIKVLKEQDFVVGEREMDLVKRRSNNSRYFFMVAKRIENGREVDRFIKVPQNNTKILLKPFDRQIKFAEYIKNNSKLSTRGVIAYNTDHKKGNTFAIFETFPIEKSKIGFIEGSDKVDMLGEKEAKSIIRDMEIFHGIDIKSLPNDLRKLLHIRKVGRGFDYIKNTVDGAMSTKVLPLDANGKRRVVLHKLLEKRTGIKNFKKEILATLKRVEEKVRDKKFHGKYIVHGDMAPNNLYVFDDGEVELLDLEWVGMFENRVVAVVFDFGNMRIRSWKNRKFREALDKELIRVYKERGEEDIARLIIGLSILRSNVIFSGFFENYPWDKQMLPEQAERRRVAEEDIQKMWEFI